MAPETLEALKSSIEYWEKNSKAQSPGEVKLGARNCALCQLFNNKNTPPLKNCRGCPVSEAARAIYCEGTPYTAAHRALTHWYDNTDKGEFFRDAARKEVDFLKSLLP